MLSEAGVDTLVSSHGDLLCEYESFSVVLHFIAIRFCMSMSAALPEILPPASSRVPAALGVLTVHALIGLTWWLYAAAPSPLLTAQPSLWVQLRTAPPEPVAEPARLPQPAPLRSPSVRPIDLPSITIQQLAAESTPVPAPTVLTPPQPPAPQPAREVQLASLPPPPPPVRQAGALRYRVAPAVEVPLASRRLGESGTVLLHVLVDAQGLPARVEVRRSSGHARLDAQALAAMRSARFEPCTDDGRPVPCEADAPIAYELEP
jgi:protein TonB